MKVEDDKHCFACGHLNEYGLHADITVNDDNTSCCKISVPSRFQGWKGMVHGGIISTLLDEISIYACRKISLRGVTAEIYVKFRKPVPIDTELELKAKVTEIRRKMVSVQAELLIDGVVHATADTKVFNLE
ncbi:MAG: PaaI family thioesterase [Candidatus Delongbacteria bacterium]